MDEITMLKRKRGLTGRQKDLVFYILILAWPVLQFCVFYIGVNANSFLMAFQKLDLSGRVTEWTFQYVEQGFKAFFGLDGTTVFANAFRRSLQVYAVGLFIGTPLGLFFSYYIFKKFPLANMFKVFLNKLDILYSLSDLGIFSSERYFEKS